MTKSRFGNHCLLIVAALTAMTAYAGARETSSVDVLSGPANQETGVEDEPIHLTGYSYARFLAGTSTNTRFVTSTASTTVTCISKVADAANACPAGKRRRRRFIRALNAAHSSSSIDSSLLQEDHSPSELEVPSSSKGRLLFNAATTFTTLTFTQNVDGTKTISISVSCAPVGAVNLCYG